MGRTRTDGGGHAEPPNGNGDLRYVSTTSKVQVMQAPNPFDHEELLSRGPAAMGSRAARICAVQSRKYCRGSTKGNPRRAPQSRNGDYHLSEIQRASA